MWPFSTYYDVSVHQLRVQQTRTSRAAELNCWKEGNVKHSETIRREFSKQATSFGESGLTLSSQEYLAWMVDVLPLQSDYFHHSTSRNHATRAILSRE